MDKAAEEGLIHVEGSGPTYATCTVSVGCVSVLVSCYCCRLKIMLRKSRLSHASHTQSYHEAMMAAGASFGLIDSMVRNQRT